MPIGQSSTNTSSSTSGAEGAAKGLTSTLGNLTGGVVKTAGGAVGSVGQGLGETINSEFTLSFNTPQKRKPKVNANLKGTVDTTGTKAVGNGLQGLTGGVKDGADALGKGAENAGQWK